MQATRSRPDRTARPTRTVATLLIGAGLAIFTGGCAEISQAVGSTCPDDGIQLGVEPQGDRSTLAPAYSALSSALTEELDCTVTIRIFEDRKTAVQALIAHEIEIAHLTPVGYARAAREAAVVPVATFSMPNGNMATYTVGIWVPADSAITRPAHLADQVLALGAKGSTSGDAIPRAALAGAELDVEQVAISYTGGSDAALAALAGGEAEAAAFTSGTLTRATADGTFDPAAYRMIWESGTVPNDPIVLAPGLTDDFVEATQDALLSVEPQAVAQVGDAVGVDPGGHFVDVSALDYAVFLDLLE